ncbi:MAG: carboxypeptidase regulatory-like domain-containing protein [Kiritimatiellia bacterium]
MTVPAGVATGPCNFALAEGAIIQGRVTDESGYPLGGIWLDAYEESGVWLKSAVTATDGRYGLEGLPVVTCCIRTYTSTGSYADEWYDNIPVRGFEIPLEAQRFTLASGLVFSNVDFALSPGSSISGTVTDASAQPLAGAQVHAYSSAMEWIRSASTDGGGQYSIQRLPAGSYFVRTEAGAMGFADEWFDDVPVIGSSVPGEAALITLTTGEARTNMNFVLPQAGTIERMVSGSQGALSNVAMHLFDSRTNWINAAISDSSGNYSATGLHPAKLFWIRTDTGSNNYADEWFDNVSLVGRGIPVEAQPVAVTPGGVTSNINFLLAEGGILRGAVRDARGSPITNIWVNLYRSNLTWLASGQTDASGGYEITKLAPDSVFARTYSAPFAFEDKWHPNAPANSPEIPPDAQPVVVSSGIATNVDFTLGFWIAGCGVTHRHVRIVWQAASGTTYLVNMSTNLVTWTSAPNGTNAVQQNTRTATEQSFLEYEDPIPLDMPRFYRVEIAL